MVRKRSSWSVKDVSDAVLATTGAAPSIQKQVVASLKQQKQADVPSKQKQAVVQAQVVKAKCEDKAGDHAHKKRKHDGRIKAKKRTTATTAPALLKDVHFASDNMDNKSQPCDGWMDMDAMLEEQSDNEESSSVGWRRITFPASMPFTEGAAGGFCALEEVEDVQVAYEETANGRVVKFRKLCTDHAQEDVNDAPKDNAQMAIEDGIADDVSSAECSSSVDSDEDAEAIEAMRAFERSIDAQVVKAAPSSTPGTAAREEEEPVDDEAAPIVNDTPNKHWQHYSLNPSIVRAINELGFEKPTEIQERVLPLAIRKRRDIIGAAETGSGKTLAFGLPIIQALVNERKLSAQRAPTDAGLKALILTPTRELAIQVRDHMQAVAKYTGIAITAIVGGMSTDKQERLLKRCPEVIIATPGRFWELFSERESYLAAMGSTLNFLVLDEADRMVENGHFRDLDSILDALKDKEIVDEWGSDLDEFIDKTTDIGVDADAADDQDDASTQKLRKEKAKPARPRRQTMVFSATINTTSNADAAEMSKAKNKPHKKGRPVSDDMSRLMRKIDFHDSEPAIVDLTSEQVVAKALTESRVDCLQTEKDACLYYFLKRYPGRTIVFVNSITCIKRLLPIFQLLDCKVYGLHAQMQQRQRLKNLDRFKVEKDVVLMASDVAARGLDIPLVDHVVHYQLPRSAELYVHRSGRTARANHNGISVMLCCPEEQRAYKDICRVLKKDTGLPAFPVDLTILAPIKQRIQLAVDIDKLEHTNRKTVNENGWLLKAAEDMDIDLDDEELMKNVVDGTHGDDDRSANASRVNKQKEARRRSLRAQLKRLLATPILPHGVSSRYVAGGQVAGLARQLLDNQKQLAAGAHASTVNNVLPASKPSKAHEDVAAAVGSRDFGRRGKSGVAPRK